MATPAERFVREARAIRSLGTPPATWDAEFADVSGVAVYAAELCGADGEKQLLTPETDATARQHRAFSAARSAWQRYGGERSIVPLVATGDEPRPWLALDPPEAGDLADRGPLPDATVRALLADLAEGCWVIRQSAWSGALDPRQYRVAADGATAAVHWPLSVRDGSDSSAVRTIGEIGYEAITGEEPAAHRESPLASVRDGGQYSERLCEVVETALAAPPERYATPYELKRALLFGPEAEGVSEPHRSPGPKQAEHGSRSTGGSESGAATAAHDGPPDDGKSDQRATARGRSDSGVGRRAVVGALGLSVIPLAGAFAVRSPGDGAGSPTPDPPDASFVFADEGTAIRVTHTGGDPIAADRLIVRNTRYSGIDNYPWKAFSAGDVVEPGDTVSIDIGGRIRMFAHVVWQSPEGEEVVLDRRQSATGTRERSDPNPENSGY